MPRDTITGTALAALSKGRWEIRALPSFDHVAMVRKIFPDWSDEVYRLAVRDETFRDMCEKYGRSVMALDLLEIRNRPHDVERMDDYRKLIKELESSLKHELLAARDPGWTRKRAVGEG